jgi:predicted transcriptional regulator
MALQLPPELEQRVTRIAHESARNPADVLADIVSSALELDSDEELWAAVADSDAEFARGEGIPHEQVVQEMQAIIDHARTHRR